MDLCNAQGSQGAIGPPWLPVFQTKGQNFLIAAWVPSELRRNPGSTAAVACWRWVPASAPDPTAVPPGRAGDRCGGGPESGARFAGDSREYSNLHILWQDILKVDIPALVQAELPGLRPMACANLPYYIPPPRSSLPCWRPGAFPLSPSWFRRRWPSGWPPPPGPGIPALSPCSAITTPSRSFSSTCPLSCFLPQPKVTSSVVRLDIRQSPPCPVEDEALFFRVVRAGFAQRRKQLQNGLAAGFPALGKEKIGEILRACGLSPRCGGNPGHSGLCPDRRRHRPRLRRSHVSISLFDLDDTLLDFHRAEAIAVAKAFKP